VNPLPGDLTEAPAPTSMPLKPRQNNAADLPGGVFQRRLEGVGQSELPFQ
jgi:hypothetical protein